ncbi:hypothetical protein C2S52_007899 [Perilla frutescens var. hirtella]|nr:hypothetical protein C2S52_007899 [Perilla frutescens var. hirtella]
MERPESKLFEAAAKGCLISLQQLLSDDPLILDRVIANYYSETPLHVAAMLGHIDFVKEIIHIKPQLTNELNSQLSSPLHLASAKGHVDVVRALLSVDHHTCLARDSNGLTPLHLAAIKGRDEVVKLLLQAQPDAARLTSYGDETILHLCVKNHQLEALKLLVTAVSEPEFVNSKDVDGNTVLHLAVEYKQVETTIFLVSVAGPALVNAVNHEGLTAVDVLIRSRRDVRDSEIEESLKHGGGIRALETDMAPPHLSSRVKTKSWETKWLDGFDEKKNALMVVASLIATMAFQIGVNPPGGVWQEDNFLMDSRGNMVDPRGNPMPYPVDEHNKTVLYPRKAGHSVLARNNPVAYEDFYWHNTIGFVFSLYIIFFLMSGLPLRNRFLVWILKVAVCTALTMTYSNYNEAVRALTPNEVGDEAKQDMLRNSFYLWSGVWILIFVGYLVRMLFRACWRLVRLVTRLIRRLFRLCRGLERRLPETWRSCTTATSAAAVV